MTFGVGPISLSLAQPDFPAIDSIAFLKRELNHDLNSRTLSNLTYKIADLYYNQFVLDSADKYWNASLSYSKEGAIADVQGKSLYWIGNLNYDRGNRAEAIRIHHQALKVFQESGDSLWIAKTQNVIGNSYNYLGEHDQAKIYYREAQDIFKRIGDRKGYAFVNENLGIIYGEEGDPEMAIALYLESEEELIRIGEEKYLGTTYYNMSIQYREMGQIDNALTVIRNALEIAKKDNNKSLTGLVYQEMGLIEITNKNYKKALPFLEEALKIGEETDNEQVRANAIQNLTLCYEGMGDFKKALGYAKRSRVLDSLLYNTQNAEIISEVETKYQVAQKDQENEILKQIDATNKTEIEKQRLITWIVVAGALVLVTFLILMYMALNKINKHKDQIEKQADKLRQLDEYKSRFFANISHDIRTPLTLISGYAHQVKTDHANYLTEQSLQNLAKLERNSRKLNDMAEEIRDLILLEEGNLKLNFTRVRIDSYLSLVVNMFSSAADVRRTELNYNSDIDPDVVVHMDRNKFEQIIYNIISNAFKYTPEGGKVMVDLSQPTPSEILISIRDTGTGIAKEHLSMIFDRYYQTPDNEFKEKEGFGIGLALVKELTNLHGGEINVESEKGVGTTFNLKLPLNHDIPADEEELETSLRNFDLSTEPNSPNEKTFVGSGKDGLNVAKVLVVDDHAEVRDYISKIVQTRFSVFEAKNGQHALNILENQKVDVILTDLMMPWLDGFELIEKLKEDPQLQQIPVMVVSARTTEEDKLRVLNSGVNDFMSKPFDPEKLIKRIENLVESKGNGSHPWANLLDERNEVEKDIIEKINGLIIEKIDDSTLSVKDIADEICASERKTFRLIKDLTGHTPLEYMKWIRFDYAKDLLIGKKVKSASEAAKAIGMSNVTQFNKQYRKFHGISPIEG